MCMEFPGETNGPDRSHGKPGHNENLESSRMSLKGSRAHWTGFERHAPRMAFNRWTRWTRPTWPDNRTDYRVATPPQDRQTDLFE